MQASVIELYEKLASAPDDRARARIIAEAIQALTERFPHLDHLATRQNLSETELRLLKEIEQVRADLKETELRLSKAIEEVRADLTKEIEQVRADLTKDIERVRSDLSVRIERSKAETIRWVAGLWLAQTAVIAWLVLRAVGGP